VTDAFNDLSYLRVLIPKINPWKHRSLKTRYYH